ncbi:MAG: ATP-dependent sacrificial sulfur transferase LarE [Chthoniobacterales bacterium]|nr:ATP-dependent sacrificial sulfur transferase LarE [Chthoniobacterales bacterium]
MDFGAEADGKLRALRDRLRAHAPLVIAYSGGVDSAFLLAVAAESVGADCLGVIADSPSLPRQALAEALELAREIGAGIEVVPTAEMADPNYTSNPINRCYFCKAELFTKLDRLARERGFRAIAYGENADDAQQVRPGRKAAAEFQVLAPLKDVGLTKSEIRALSRIMRLPTADAPAQPCLSSRIPHGTPVAAAALAMIERAEAIVRSFGFRVFRVRHHVQANRPQARVEILPNEMVRLEGSVDALRSALRGVGYDEVLIDPRGYRSPVA